MLWSLTVEETVLLIPIPSYTATTLIVQLLPGEREEKVWVVALETVTDPWVVDDDELHDSWQEYETL